MPTPSPERSELEPSHSQETVPAEQPPGPDAAIPVSLRDERALPCYAEGEMAERIREFEWAETPLGPIADWPPELGNAVNIMLGAGEAISIYWGERHILLYNDDWRTFIGDKHPEALGQPAREVFPEIWETIQPRFEHVLAGKGAAFERGQRFTFEREGHPEDTWFDYSFNPIAMADGSVGGVLNIGTEVTERMEAERALRESEAFHRLAADAGNMGTWSVDLETGNAILSPRMAELMGYAPDEHEAVPGQPDSRHWQQMVPPGAWMASVHPDDRRVLRQSIAAAEESEEPMDLEFRVQDDGEIRWLYAKGEVPPDGPGEGPRLRGASVEITQRRKLEEALVGASEAVRRNIGRELHDVLSSDLAALGIQADNLACKLRQASLSSEERPADDSGLDEMIDALGKIADGVREAAKQARNLSHGLMPAALQEGHLATALEHLCREQAELGTPPPTFEGDSDEPLPHSQETAMHLYRIAREAITNAQRHAEADHIRVPLCRKEDQLALTIQDDGIGLTETESADGGIGLRTMEHRADLIGASFSIESSPQDGTSVRCLLPLSRATGE